MFSKMFLSSRVSKFAAKRKVSSKIDLLSSERWANICGKHLNLINIPNCWGGNDSISATCGTNASQWSWPLSKGRNGDHKEGECRCIVRLFHVSMLNDIIGNVLFSGSVWVRQSQKCKIYPISPKFCFVVISKDANFEIIQNQCFELNLTKANQTVLLETIIWMEK